MKFSQAHHLGHTQAELDFVDIDSRIDLPLFLDPYAFAVNDDNFSIGCHSDLTTFFQAVLAAVVEKDELRGHRLLNDLNEPNETCLGWSRGRPQGRGIGALQANQLYRRLAASEAARTGLLSSLSDCELFIDGIGPDKISDITTNIVRGRLIEYTQEQCALHGIEKLQKVPSGLIWSAERASWEQGYVHLPVVDGRKILLVPKAFVRWPRDISHQHQRYYQHFVLNFLRSEHLRSGSSLVRILKDGRQRVYKEDLKKENPLTKDFLFKFSRDNPQVFENYKNSVRAQKRLRNEDLDDSFDEAAFANSLIQALKNVPPGRDDADHFHRLMIGILEFIFFPSLVCPKKETPIHEGRKKIDITYMNAASEGFFWIVPNTHDVPCRLVMVECKNYSSDPANPELDQLAGRFSANRGKLGLLLARSFTDRDLFLRRCCDTARDSNNYIVPLVDEDIRTMLTMISDGRRSQITNYMLQIFRNLLL